MKIATRDLRPGDVCLTITGTGADLVVGIVINTGDRCDLTFLHLFGRTLLGDQGIFCRTLSCDDVFFNVVRAE